MSKQACSDWKSKTLKWLPVHSVTISSESQQNKGVTTHHGQLISTFINWYKSGHH